MKIRLSLLTAALFATQALAGTQTTVPTLAESTPSFKHISGSLTLGAETNYVGRGLVATHAAEQGDGTETIALKLDYKLSENSPWSFGNIFAYKILSEGHTLYGSPTFGPNIWAGAVSQNIPGNPTLTPEQAVMYGGEPREIKQCNMENEFAIVTAAHYTQEKWNVGFGHRFVHGGILGVMAKHYRDQGASVVNEVFIAPEWTPTKWFALGCTASYSFQGISGWWIEPQATFKARILGTEEKTVLAALCTFGMSATASYFSPEYVACCNGAQAFWIKLSTPWFATKHLIITPSVSFNWAGPGALKSNKVSEFRYYSEDPTCIPFRDFAVVGGISATYKF